MKLEILPVDQERFNVFTAQPGIKIVQRPEAATRRVEAGEGLYRVEPCILVFYEQAPTMEDIAVKEAEQAAQAELSGMVKANNDRRIAHLIMTSFTGDEIKNEYLVLKNDLQREIWLRARKFEEKDLSQAISMMKVEMMPTTVKLASEYQASAGVEHQ